MWSIIGAWMNRNCHWGHDLPLWGEPFNRGFKRYGDDTEYYRSYQRRTCKRCGKVEEKRIVS